MDPQPVSARDHYDTFLAEQYVWMAGGFGENLQKNRVFHSARNIHPSHTGSAIDLGAGCGFVTIPLLEAGFRVTAVDFCRPLLDQIPVHAPQSSSLETVEGDLQDFPVWAGRRPELIACMGDTLTHLSGAGAVRDLFRQCHRELIAGGRLVLSLRDYSREPEGDVVVIPVRRDADRIFLCRLEYSAGTVTVNDILYSRATGFWVRSAGSYRKLRMSPGQVSDLLEETGFRIESSGAVDGMITFVAVTCQPGQT